VRERAAKLIGYVQRAGVIPMLPLDGDARHPGYLLRCASCHVGKPYRGAILAPDVICTEMEMSNGIDAVIAISLVNAPGIAVRS
jgi:hypothetical protein